MSKLEAVVHTSTLGHQHVSILIRRFHALHNLRKWVHIPAVGDKPLGLHVSNRGWRRNSALVMALIEQHGHDQ